ncbi:Oleate hydratase [Mycena indigotica]|uniref:Oleate hydratase n=1 Tax=Mycena indigotica TaxID=2126181 RepID=A0A8H6SIS9_9AGAR|nr:Oleate hydratase [Mycena indigotica]KAF7298615.1 Oleate hydratase [Mycena indigotica]
MAPNLFACDACAKPIPPADPRVRCLDAACPEYDLCAVCALGERFTGQHTVEHETVVYRPSGGGHVQAGISALAIVRGGSGASGPGFAPPPKRASTSGVPPPPPPRPAGHGRVPSTGPGSPRPTHTPRPSSTFQPSPGVSQGGTSAGGTSAPGPPPQTPRADGGGWGPFFAPDMSHLPPYLKMTEAIFAYLDTGRTGYLVPEAYSHFLNDQNYVGQENVWNNNLVGGFGQTKEDAADAALMRAYDLFSIEYILRPRPRNPNAPVDPLTRQLRASLGGLADQMVPPPASGGVMPLLTLKGFAEITAIEILADPSRGWGNLSRVLKMYGLEAALGWGPLPRSVLPEDPDQRVLARAARVQATAEERAERELQAEYTKNRIAKQGREYALALLDDRRYVY